MANFAAFHRAAGPAPTPVLADRHPAEPIDDLRVEVVLPHVPEPHVYIVRKPVNCAVAEDEVEALVAQLVADPPPSPVPEVWTDYLVGYSLWLLRGSGDWWPGVLRRHLSRLTDGQVPGVLERVLALYGVEVVVDGTDAGWSMSTSWRDRVGRG